jgi:hypothetical protein
VPSDSAYRRFKLAIGVGVVAMALGFFLFAPARRRQPVVAPSTSAMAPTRVEMSLVADAPTPVPVVVVAPSVEAKNATSVRRIETDLVAPTYGIAPPDYVPASGWKNVGNATAAAALETFLWAATHGEIDELAKLVEFVRRPTSAALNGSPTDRARSEYATPEKAAALMYASTTGEAVELRSFPKFVTSPISVIITVRFVTASGGEFGQVFWIMQRPDGWRIMEHGHVVDAFVAGDKRVGTPVHKRRD